MPAIQIANPLYEQARDRAANAGFASVDEYVVEMLREAMGGEKNCEYLFTPARIAALDQIVKKMEAGGPTFTQEQIDAHFKARREAC